MSSQPNPSKITGAYQFCPFHCEVYKINSDGTFDYLIDGDLYNDQRTEGKWTWVGEDRIHLKSRDNRIINRIEEKAGDIKDDILVRVLDTMGAIFPGIEIGITDDGIERTFITDENGSCTIPQTKSIKVSALGYSETYKIENAQTSQIFIEILAGIDPHVDSIFKIEREALCKLDEDGKPFENCYKKISKKQTERLFPSIKQEKKPID